MGVIFKTDTRRVIPRFRSFENSVKTGELDESSNLISKNNFNSTDYLSEQFVSWKKNNSLPYAGDLLSSAFVLGLESEFSEVAKFIIDNDPDVDSALVTIAKKTLGIGVNIKEAVSDNSSTLDREKYYNEIRKHKFSLSKEPRNPIALVELGRLYSLLGQTKKAKLFIDRSLKLDKDNRFIVRSASRFYHHYFNDEDNALQIVKGSKFLKEDPWLISAEIAYSTILNRFSKLTKPGKQILESTKFSHKAITELASSIATVELSNGKDKDAKKYFIQSLISPNDNSLAQAEWVGDSINGLNVAKSKFDLPLAFEAKTIAYYEQKKYKESFQQSLKWISDEPYSTRPVLTASYILGTFLDNKREAIRLLRQGLEVNNGDIMLNNNLVYFLAQNDEIEEATKIFHKSLSRTLQQEEIEVDNISIIGTAGLILYRGGAPEEGKKLYLQAMRLADKTTSEYLSALAIGNYLREELRITKNPVELTNYISKFGKMNVVKTEDDIRILFHEVLNSYEKLLHINV